MNSPNLISQTIRFQRAAFANTLTIMTAMQQHSGDLLKSTIGQTSWLSGNSRKACLLANDALTTSLQNMTTLIDQGFVAMEQFSQIPIQPDKAKEEKKGAAAPAARKKSPTAKKDGQKSKAKDQQLSKAKPVPKKTGSEQWTKPSLAATITDKAATFLLTEKQAAEGTPQPMPASGPGSDQKAPVNTPATDKIPIDLNRR